MSETRTKAARTAERSSPADASQAERDERPVLLVEDSPFAAKVISRSIADEQARPVVLARSQAEAEQALFEAQAPFLAAVTDLDLPDAPDGEIVDVLVSRSVPTIVLTASYDEAVRERVLGQGIVDYHIKGAQSLAHVNETLRRLVINPSVKVLVVDDSSAYRRLLRTLLERHLFQVVEAGDGLEGLAALEQHPETLLVVTDYEMPNMNGIEFVSCLRERHRPDELAILGASSVSSAALSARFLKFGADDFVNKPFQSEEFYCRVYHGLRMLEQIQMIKRAAFTDQLTRLDNRLSFFTTVPELYGSARSTARGEGERRPFAVAMADIDHFKRINDTYGHAGGDVALVHLAGILRGFSPRWFVARFGGEEFCLVGDGLSRSVAEESLEALRAEVEASSVDHEGQTIRFTLSVGGTTTLGESLDGMINHADEALYEAKETSRNRVVFKD